MVRSIHWCPRLIHGQINRILFFNKIKGDPTDRYMYIILNCNMPIFFERRDGKVCVCARAPLGCAVPGTLAEFIVVGFQDRPLPTYDLQRVAKGKSQNLDSIFKLMIRSHLEASHKLRK
jgi:hypothetical protein